MNIGSYTFEEFRTLAENFHGYAAPGLLIGGYMVEKCKAALPQGALFEAVAESPKCLPDAVQLLTACSTGNQRLKIHNLGRYAVSLFDKYTGKGFRVSLDPEKMRRWPELYAWFFKQKPKKEQDSRQLEREIREAGDSICKIAPVQIKKQFVGQKHMRSIAVCPICGEAFPGEDGAICRGCQGEAPYAVAGNMPDTPMPYTVAPVEEAIGKTVAHDMTRIEPGQFKGPEFLRGQRVSPGDVCRLQTMGRFHIAVQNESGDAEKAQGGMTHEDDAARAFALRMAGAGVFYDAQPREGKINFRAAIDGLLCVDEERLRNFNLVPQVMAASRQDATVVRQGGMFAGTRAIPLYLKKATFELALDALAGTPLFRVLPMRRGKAGILVTGTEVFQGLIEDKFIPVITAKLLNLNCDVEATAIAPDDKEAMAQAAEKMFARGIDLLVTTGGMSVDPDDVTRQALLEMGLCDVVHGVPVLPGAMSLTGKIDRAGRRIDVLGVPACALFAKTTFLDLVLPRILAGRGFTRQEAANMASGGFCLSCKVCSWPKCSFGK